MNDHVPTLIVVKPGRMRDSLRALLRAIPRIKVVGQVDDGPTAVQRLTDHRPALVLLASNLPGDQTPRLLRQIKAKSPQTRCLVLADTLQQQWLAESAGADGVLLSGFPAAKFFATVEALLSRQGARQ